MRNLAVLQKAAPTAAFRQFIQKNADSVWARDRFTNNNTLGLVWSGAPNNGGAPTAATQSSAADALVAAVAVS